MSWEGLVPLAVLALVDSTSFGTLVIPLWLIITPRVRPLRLLAYLATVGAAYLLLGVLILTGGHLVAEPIGDALGSRPGQVLLLVVGVGLVVSGFLIEPLTRAGKARRQERREQRLAERGPTRMQRWRETVAQGETPTKALMVLALTAVAVEAASMVPYLAALGILGTADLTLPVTLLVLVGYCVVMVVPALVLLGVRLALHRVLVGPLARLEGWLSRNSRETVAWVVTLLGLFIARGAAVELGILG